MFRRFGLLLTASALGLTALASPAPTLAAGYVGGCVLQGQANFGGSGLTTTAADFTYNFSGTLTNCNSSNSGDPASGTIEAGNIVTIGGVKYQEPIPTGNGTCGNGTTAGVGFVTWADGTTTIVSYTTTSAGPAVNLQGTVLSSVVLKAVSGSGSTTVTSSRNAGYTTQGALTFGTTSPQDCAGTGLTSASINGLTGYYSTTNNGAGTRLVTRFAGLRF